MKVGLYFGTFNPIHMGHLIIANHMVEFSNLDEIWMVVTPQSPHKQKKSLLNNYHRLEMVYLAVKELPKIKPSDIEFSLPQPNYTITTLTHLKEKHPSHDFSIIMGEDNLNSFHKWKNHEAILDDYSIYVYPRVTKDKAKNDFMNHSKVTFVEAPRIEISSTFIRKAIQENKNVSPMLPKDVSKFIDEMNFYK